MFEAVFLKDAILNNKIYDDFLIKLADFFDRSDVSGLEKYLNERYYSKMNDTTKKFLFRNLWSLAFYVTDDDCTRNRKALCYALVYLTKTDTKMFIEYFKENMAYLSNKILCEKIDITFYNKDFTFHDYPIFSLIYFLSEFPQFYALVSDDKKVEIENVCIKNVNLLLFSSYISPSMEEHVRLIKSEINGYNYCIEPGVFLKAYENSKNTNSSSQLRKLAIFYFCNHMNSNIYQPDFDYINSTYKDIICKIINDFNKEDLLDLLTGMCITHKYAKIFPLLRDQIISLANNGMDINIHEYEILND